MCHIALRIAHICVVVVKLNIYQSLYHWQLFSNNVYTLTLLHFLQPDPPRSAQPYLSLSLSLFFTYSLTHPLTPCLSVCLSLCLCLSVCLCLCLSLSVCLSPPPLLSLFLSLSLPPPPFPRPCYSVLCIANTNHDDFSDRQNCCFLLLLLVFCFCFFTVPSTRMSISGTDLLKQSYSTLRQKLQIEFSISPTHSILTPDQPVPVLTLQRQTPGWVVTGGFLKIFKKFFLVTSMIQPGKNPGRKRESNAGQPLLGRTSYY